MLDLGKLPEAIRFEGGISRRLFLAYSSTLSSIPLIGQATWAESAPIFQRNPFSLGVASGDPAPRSVVLWTKLATKPLEPYGGMPAHALKVKWEIAEDESFAKIVGKGNVLATPQLGHSVHVTANGLKPDRWYWYRFMSGDAMSPVGRTRTMPATWRMPEKLRFAVTSCQNFEQGLFTAYQQMQKDEVDLVFSSWRLHL